MSPFLFVWRRERDSNPRYAFNVYSLSRGAPSAARPSLLNKLSAKSYFSYSIKLGTPLLRRSRVIRYFVPHPSGPLASRRGSKWPGHFVSPRPSLLNKLSAKSYFTYPIKTWHSPATHSVSWLRIVQGTSMSRPQLGVLPRVS